MTSALTRRLVDVQPERVRWLWTGRIPLGKLTILDGDPGLGKSALTLDLAARLTTGRPMPDGTMPDLDGAAGVLLLTAEDGLGDTVRPRLDAMHADTSRVVALEAVYGEDGASSLPMIPQDVETLAGVVQDEGALLVLIDPLMAYLGGDTNSYRDQDVRRALTPMASLAEMTGAAVVIIRHLNKGAASNPVYRGGGSIGIIGAARSGLLVARDPDADDRRILAVTKANLSKPVPALAYRLDEAANGALYVTWEGATAHTAAQLLSVPANDEERGAQSEAIDFLRDILAAGPVAANDVKRQAREAGISDITLRRARERLGIRPTKQGMAGGWTWALPPKVIIEPRSCSPSEHEHVRAFDEHLRESATNGHCTARRCSVCGTAFKVTPSDRPGWVKVSCRCNYGASTWAHENDPALVGSAS